MAAAVPAYKIENLYMDSLNGDSEAVDNLLFRDKVDPNTMFGKMPILLVVCLGTKDKPKVLEVAQLLIKAKADVNGKDEFGAPIVDRIIEDRNIPALKILLDSKKVDLSGDNMKRVLTLTGLIGKWQKPEWAKDGPIMEKMLKESQSEKAASDKKDNKE